MLSRAPLKVVRNWVCDSRQWDDYKPREGDIVIATAPKTGTTWTQHIVNLLVFQSPEPRPLFELSPWIDCRFMMPIEAMLTTIEAQQHRRFMKSHLPLDALPMYEEVRYIHVARAGLDACMSFLNHFNSFLPEAIDFVAGPQQSLRRLAARNIITLPPFLRQTIGSPDLRCAATVSAIPCSVRGIPAFRGIPASRFGNNLHGKD